MKYSLRSLMIVSAVGAAILAGVLVSFRNDPITGVAVGFVVVGCIAAYILDSLRIGRWFP